MADDQHLHPQRNWGICRFLPGRSQFYHRRLGCLCGLLGAALYFGKSVKGPYGRAVYRQIGGWVVGLAIFGLIVPGINNWAHGGGLVAGIAIGWLSGYADAKRQTVFHQALAAACIAATIIVLAGATGSALYYLLRG